MKTQLSQIIKITLIVVLSAGFMACSRKEKTGFFGKENFHTSRTNKNTPATNLITNQDDDGDGSSANRKDPVSNHRSTERAPTKASDLSVSKDVDVLSATKDEEKVKLKKRGTVALKGKNSNLVFTLNSDDSAIPFKKTALSSSSKTVNTKKQFFSDFSTNSLLSILKTEVDKLPKQIRADSKAFALSIQSVHVEANEISRQVFAEVVFNSPSGAINAQFLGDLDVDNRSIMEETLETAGDEFIFKATVVCMDANKESCENTVIRIDQYTYTSQIQKTAFAMHRVGKVHMQFFMRDFHKYKNSQNPMLKDFMYYMKNTHDAVVGINSCRQSGRSDCKTLPMRAPGAAKVELSSFAIAYGHSSFFLTLRSVSTITHPEKDVLIFSAPLILSDNVQSTQTNLNTGGFIEVSNGLLMSTQSKYEPYFSRIRLLSRDGDDNMLMRVHFNDPRGAKGEAVSIVITVTSKILKARKTLRTY